MRAPRRAELPIGFEPADFTRALPPVGAFDPGDGNMHVCAVGTLLPMGLLTVLSACLFLLKQRDVKRLLAYSSMENVGLMAIAIAIGFVLYRQFGRGQRTSATEFAAQI